MSETALAMEITHETVKTHLKRAQAKLGARNGKHAVWLYAKSEEHKRKIAEGHRRRREGGGL
jgi:DNA-binding CsgD family transcriptional regulator